MLPWYPYMPVPIYAYMYTPVPDIQIYQTRYHTLPGYPNVATIICCHDIQMWGKWVFCWNVLKFEHRLTRTIFRYERLNEARNRKEICIVRGSINLLSSHALRRNTMAKYQAVCIWCSKWTCLNSNTPELEKNSTNRTRAWLQHSKKKSKKLSP
jgi:hypothetical protein